MRNVLRNDRGTSVVEAPFCICIILMLGMGVTTLVQMTWTHLSLSSAVRSTTRYATHVDYDPAATPVTGDRHRTEDQVLDWAEEVAAEAGVAREQVSIVGRHLPSGDEAPIDELVAGDEIVITVETVVKNPLYRLAAAVTNVASNVIGAGDVFDPEGVGIRAGAVTYVE